MTFVAPPKVKEKAAAKWADALRPLLGPDETIWAFTRITRFRPMTEGVAVTNHRLLGFWSQGATHKRVPLQVAARDIVAIEFREKHGLHKLVVSTPSGEVNFGDVRKDELDFARHYISHFAGQNGVQLRGGPATTAAVASGSSAPPVEPQTVPSQGRVYGGPLDKRTLSLLAVNSRRGEVASFVINNSPVSVLAAFADRLVVAGSGVGRYGMSLNAHAQVLTFAEIASISYTDGIGDGLLELARVPESGRRQTCVHLRIPSSLAAQAAPEIEALRGRIRGPRNSGVEREPHGQSTPAVEEDDDMLRDPARPGQAPTGVLGDGQSGSVVVYEDRVVVSVGHERDAVRAGASTTLSWAEIKRIDYSAGEAHDLLTVVSWRRDGASEQEFRLPMPRHSRRVTVDLVEQLRRKIALLGRTPVSMTKMPTPTRTSSPGGVASELAKLADLFNQGLIDADEFKAAKRAVLAAHSV